MLHWLPRFLPFCRSVNNPIRVLAPPSEQALRHAAPASTTPPTSDSPKLFGAAVRRVEQDALNRQMKTSSRSNHEAHHELPPPESSTQRPRTGQRYRPVVSSTIDTYIHRLRTSDYALLKVPSALPYGRTSHDRYPARRHTPSPDLARAHAG